MDFYFKDVSPEFMLTCMRYYALRFHIDGFRFNQECVSVEAATGSGSISFEIIWLSLG